MLSIPSSSYFFSVRKICEKHVVRAVVHHVLFEFLIIIEFWGQGFAADKGVVKCAQADAALAGFSCAIVSGTC